jgi:hypothetical protein
MEKPRRPPAVHHPLPWKKPTQIETPSAVIVIEQHEEKISELQLKVLRLEEEVRTLDGVTTVSSETFSGQ